MPQPDQLRRGQRRRPDSSLKRVKIGRRLIDRLVAEIESELEQAAAKSERTGKPARCFRDFVWRTHSSWSCQRRVVAKAEWAQ
jgi:hypothetical protein